LQDYSQGVVFRHEQTLAQPRTDRLHLLEATRAHFGPIFMLYSDPALTVERTLFGASFRAEIELTDEFGVEHQLARISDPNTINILAGAMADKKLIIADGHHRYETALQYSREHAPAIIPHQERNLSNSLPAPSFPEAAVMMTYVNMDAEGLVILPTHRVVHGLDTFNPADFLKRAESFFTIRPLAAVDAEDLVQTLAAAGENATAFIAAIEGGRFLLTARPEISTGLASLPERQAQLDVVQLHAIVLEKLLGISAEAIQEQRNLRYIRDAQEALEQVAGGTADLALLMNPCTLEQLQEIAFAGDVMPQKSTDFYPKLLSGLAIYALD